MKSKTTETLRLIADYLMPPTCIGCEQLTDAGKNPICDKCFAEVSTLFNQPCKLCGMPTELCKCTASVKLGNPIFLMFYKEKLSKHIIYMLKYHVDIRHVRFLSAVLAEKYKRCRVGEEGLKNTVITYVPRSKKSIREHGYDQAKLLAEEMSKQLKIACLPLLVNIKQGGEQKEMGIYERQLNVENEYSINTEQCKKAKDDGAKKVIIVDDIITTGMTINRCKTLLENKHFCIDVATVMKAQNSAHSENSI